MLRFFIKTGVLVAICQSTQAGDVQMFKTPPSAEEMGRVLFSKESNPNAGSDVAPPQVKTRSISFGKKLNEPVEKRVETHTLKSSDDAMGLPIEFAYNSSQISTTSIPFLAEIGKMLSLPEFSTKRMVIEGHTDAVGSEDYNRYLSKMRAEAIKNYLVDNYQIQPNRLTVIGLGESDPLPEVDPNDAINRRVQFRSSN